MEDRVVLVTRNGIVKLNSRFKELKYLPFAMVSEAVSSTNKIALDILSWERYR